MKPRFLLVLGMAAACGRDGAVSTGQPDAGSDTAAVERDASVLDQSPDTTSGSRESASLDAPTEPTGAPPDGRPVDLGVERRLMTIATLPSDLTEQILVDDQHVFLALSDSRTADGSLVSVPKNGGAPLELATVIFRTEMAVYDGYAYWGQFENTSTSTIRPGCPLADSRARSRPGNAA